MNQPTNPWAVRHDVDRISVTLNLQAGGVVQLHAEGRSQGKRAALWTYNELFGPANSSLAPHDAAAHLLLVCLQDRPRSRDELDRCLRGGATWENVELPWT